VGKGRGATCGADTTSRLGFWERRVITRALALLIRATSNQKEVMVSSWCGATAAGINSGARVGVQGVADHGHGVHLCIGAQRPGNEWWGCEARPRMPALARCSVRWPKKYRRRRARGMTGRPRLSVAMGKVTTAVRHDVGHGGRPLLGRQRCARGSGARLQHWLGLGQPLLLGCFPSSISFPLF
jgi:hypothetical protein